MGIGITGLGNAYPVEVEPKGTRSPNICSRATFGFRRIWSISCHLRACSGEVARMGVKRYLYCEQY